MTVNDKERADHLLGQALLYKAAFALVFGHFICSKPPAAQIAFRRELSKKVSEILPQALAPHVPPGPFGDGMQVALNQILNEFLRE